MRTADPAAVVADGRAVPALVHRPGVAVTVGPDGVALPAGRVVIDTGAHAHRPADLSGAGELSDAVEGSRPVFPWRPVVLLLGTDPDADGWADAVALVDALQDVDVDARLALPSPPSVTSRWVQPARASEITLRRVRPDAVLAWDAGAVAAAEAWSHGLRSLVVVERAGDGADVSTVPWRIGIARGRVRGTFGRVAAPADLAALVRRLAAGPQPEAPDPAVVIGRRPRIWDNVDPTAGVHRSPRSRSCVLVVGQVSPEARRAVDAFAAHLGRANVAVEVVSPAALPPGAATADIVVLRGVGAHQAAARDLAARRGARPTVVQLDETDLDADGGLAASSRDLIARCGAAVASTGEGLQLLRDAPIEARVRAIRLPDLMPAGRYTDLAGARAQRHPGPLQVIGWAPGGVEATTAPDRAVEEALGALLASRPSARVDMVRGGDRLHDHAGVRRLQHELQPHSGARWSLLLWSGVSRTPLRLEPELLDEAAVLGVPSLVAGTGGVAMPGRTAVTEPDRADAWSTAIAAVLDDARAGELLAFEAAAAADSLHRPAAADTVVHRFLGWLDGVAR